MNYTLTLCINAYEKSNLLRLGIDLLSLLYTFKDDSINRLNKLRDNYYRFIRNSANVENALDLAREFYDENPDFTFDERPFPNDKINLLFVVDASQEHKDASEMFNVDVIKLFMKFCEQFQIYNYTIMFAKHNYQIQVMRTLAFHNCKGDFEGFCDDDDIYGTSLFRKYDIILEELRKRRVVRNPREHSIRISFKNTVMLNREGDAITFNREISGMCSKVLSKRLCDLIYHIPSVRGGEDFLTNRRIIGNVVKPYEDKYGNFTDIQISIAPLVSYIWFPSGRNVNIGEVQNKMSQLHALRNGLNFNANPKIQMKKDNMVYYTPIQIQKKFIEHAEKKLKPDYRDYIYHEDSIVTVFVYDNDTNTMSIENTFICPRLTFTGIPPRNVRIRNMKVEIIDKSKKMPSWCKDVMEIDYWNEHLMNTGFDYLF